MCMHSFVCITSQICIIMCNLCGMMSCIQFHPFCSFTGTSSKTNYNAMQTIQKNTIFTNVAETSDGGFFWEGLEQEIPEGVKIRSWLGDEDWRKDSSDRPAAHPNSRYQHFIWLTCYLIPCTSCYHRVDILVTNIWLASIPLSASNF